MTSDPAAHSTSAHKLVVKAVAAAEAIPPYSPSAVTGWRAQFSRMGRSLKAVEAIESDVAVKQDRLVHFYQDCWHLKDHIHNDDSDSSLTDAIRRAIVAAAHADPDLKACRELCNGTKHARLYTPANATLTDDYGRTVFIGGTDGQSATTADVRPIVRLSNPPPGREPEEDAVQVARDAYRAWLQILANHRLINL